MGFNVSIVEKFRSKAHLKGPTQECCMKRVVFNDLSYIFSLSNRREEQISIQSINLAFYETNV